MDTAERFRRPTGSACVLFTAVLCGIPLVGMLYVLDAYRLLPVLVFQEHYLGLFLALTLAGAYLGLPATPSAPRDRIPWYDQAAALAGLGVGLYITLNWPDLLNTMAAATPEKVGLGVVAILLVLEACRRLVGWSLIVIAVLFILYARFAYLAPGLLASREVPWDRLFVYLYLDLNALLGIPVQITATVVLAFIVFGEIFFAVGGGKLLSDLALLLVGRYRGGPAKMAVVASSLFGTISGSAVANVVVTGTFTIPLMKRAGYRAHTAGAIEAVSSNGGQLMPPVMGVTAFIMAQFLGLPYREVALAAIIPALLYYLTVFVQVDAEAARLGLRGLAAGEIPPLGRTLKEGVWFAIPVGVLIYTLFVSGLSPEKSGAYSALSALVIGVRVLAKRPGVIIKILEQAGKSLLDVTLVSAVAGFVIGAILLTNLSTALPLQAIQLSQGNLAVLLLSIAVLSVILGMGLPTTPLYILLAIVLAPALTQRGVDPLAAHLFIFYFGLMSMITPPVCIAAYAGASIAGANPMRTGYAGMRLGLAGYLVPFLFVASPALLLKGPGLDVGIEALRTVLGVTVASIGLGGHFFRALNPVERVLLAIAGLGLVVPAGHLDWKIALLLQLAGVVLGTFLALRIWRSRHRGQEVAFMGPATESGARG